MPLGSLGTNGRRLFCPYLCFGSVDPPEGFVLANRTDVSSAVFLFFVAPAAPVLQGSFVLLSNNEGGGEGKADFPFPDCQVLPSD